MPNTLPITDNIEMLNDKLSRAKNSMYCNYAFILVQQMKILTN